MLKLRVFLVAAMVLAATAVFAAPNVEIGDGPVKGKKTFIQAGYAKCGFCTVMEPTIEYLDKEFKDKMVVRYVDVIKDSAFRKKYNVESAPMQFLFDENGKIIMTHVGFCTKEEMLKMLAEYGIK